MDHLCCFLHPDKFYILFPQLILLILEALASIFTFVSDSFSFFFSISFYIRHHHRYQIWQFVLLLNLDYNLTIFMEVGFSFQHNLVLILGHYS